MLKSSWTAEILFLLITLLLAFLIILPIHNYVGLNYDFFDLNYFFIVIFFTFARYVLYLKYTPFAKVLWPKLILIFICIPLFFYFIDGIYNFQRMLDEEGLEPLVSSADLNFRWNLAKYIRYQFLFFSTGSIMLMFILPVRMIISIWRVRNKGTV